MENIITIYSKIVTIGTVYTRISWQQNKFVINYMQYVQ